MFSLSKIFWGLFNPGNLLLLGIAVAALGSFVPWSRVRGGARGLFVLCALIMLLIAALPLGTWLILPLEQRFAAPQPMPAHVDGVVVLGGAIHLARSAALGSVQVNEHGERMIAFADLARRYPEARLIFAGGSGSLRNQEYKESDFAPELMAALGIAPARVVFERDSRNTYENALFTKRMAQPAAGEVWLLITSAFHMPRAVGVFRKTGWQIVPYPVDYLGAPDQPFELGLDFTSGLVKISQALHEWIGLAAYRMIGWSDSVFPGPAKD